MRTSVAILSAGLALATAQSGQTIPFIFPGAEGVDPVASVISANPSTTALALACPTDVDSTECGFGPGFRFSIISTTIYQATMQAGDASMSLSCEHNTAKSVLTCGVDVEGSDANSPGSTTAVLSGSDIVFMTATITAGGEKLSGGVSQSGTASSSAGAQPSGTGLKTSVKPTASGTASAGAQPSASGPSATQSGTGPKSTTGAAVRFGVQGSALLALAGVAVVGAL